jgi:hypothetical protein
MNLPWLEDLICPTKLLPLFSASPVKILEVRTVTGAMPATGDDPEEALLDVIEGSVAWRDSLRALKTGPGGRIEMNGQQWLKTDVLLEKIARCAPMLEELRTGNYFRECTGSEVR